VVSVSANSTNAAVKSDGSLWVWGLKIYENSDDTFYNESILIPKKIADEVISVSTGVGSLLAVKEDASLWTWGLSGLEFEQFYEGAFLTFPIIEIMDDVAHAFTSILNRMSIKNDKSLWVWGIYIEKSGQVNELGDYRLWTCVVSTPEMIMENVVSATCEGGHYMAVKTDGTLWSWGFNGLGQLGDGTRTDSIIPIMIMDGMLRLDNNSSLWQDPILTPASTPRVSTSTYSDDQLPDKDSLLQREIDIQQGNVPSYQIIAAIFVSIGVLGITGCLIYVLTTRKK
jgi:alpha-tubulin suppressor-like RCC1 family protein